MQTSPNSRKCKSPSYYVTRGEVSNLVLPFLAKCLTSSIDNKSTHLYIHDIMIQATVWQMLCMGQGYPHAESFTSRVQAQLLCGGVRTTSTLWSCYFVLQKFSFKSISSCYGWSKPQKWKPKVTNAETGSTSPNPSLDPGYTCCWLAHSESRIV